MRSTRKVSHKLQSGSTGTSPAKAGKKKSLAPQMSASASPRFALRDYVRDLRQGGKIVTIGGIIYNDDPLNRDYHYKLGCSPVIRRERDLELWIPAAFDARELKRTVDFVAIVSRYTKLRHAGRQFVGLCPFHSESSPSFYVHPERKIWKCFGCARGGDVLDFVMFAEGCDFSRALRIIRDFSAGVARESERRSRERFRAREGAQPLARAAGAQHSQNARDSIVATLDATDARLRAIAEANRAASEDFQTACEPDRAVTIFIRHRITSIPNTEERSHGRR